MAEGTKHILVLGGTSFLGRAIVDCGLEGGHEVTLFNRGVTNAELYPKIEKLRGDRLGDLSALEGRKWDAVIDVAAYEPEVAERSAGLLREAVERYVFVSTISVYASQDTVAAQREDAAVVSLAVAGDDAGALYGAKKALCEEAVVANFGERATIARPGLIVGPYDPTDRFGYWPRRLETGGRVLAPESPEYHVQFIDVRDLGDWLVTAAVENFAGTFNLTGLPTGLGRLIDACRVPGVPAEIVYIESDRLLAEGVEPWMGIPLWITGEGYSAANDVDSSAALANGLSFRPLEETVAGAREHPCPLGDHTLSAGRERELLDLLAP